MFRFWWQSIARIKLQTIAAVLQGFVLDESQLATVVVNWMQIPSGWVLSLDRTTWKFGNHWYNILTLGIVHEGVAFPVLCWMLDKRGNSSSEKRMQLMESFHKRFPKAIVNYLCGDREFIGQAWLRYLALSVDGTLG